MLPSGVYAVLIPLAAIVSATVAAWHRVIDGQTYAAIVAGTLGLGAGAGIHAAGTQQATNTAAATAATVAKAESSTGSVSTQALEAEIARRGAGVGR